LQGLRLGHDLLQIIGRERLQHIDRGTREQRRVHLERGVLGGRAGEGEQAAFHVRQKRVLLRLVEAVHLIDENDGALRREAVPRLLGQLDRLANVLHAAQHRADGDELRVERLRHEPRDRRLARARRPPEDARMRLPGFERQAQRLAWPEHLRLADHLGKLARAQALGQGGVGRSRFHRCGSCK